MLKNQRLVELRKRAGYRQEDVSELLNTSRPNYVRYEKGASQPPNDSIVKLAEIFNVTTDYLLGTSDNPAPSNAKEKAPTLESEMELLRDYMLRKLGREPTPEELARLDNFNETYIKGLNK